MYISLSGHASGPLAARKHCIQSHLVRGPRRNQCAVLSSICTSVSSKSPGSTISVFPRLAWLQGKDPWTMVRGLSKSWYGGADEPGTSQRRFAQCPCTTPSCELEGDWWSMVGNLHVLWSTTPRRVRRIRSIANACVGWGLALMALVYGYRERWKKCKLQGNQGNLE